MKLSLSLALAIAAPAIVTGQTPREAPPAPARDIGAAYGWLRPNDTVRVWAREPRLNGDDAALQRIAGDTMSLSSIPGRIGRARPIQVVGSSITRLDVLERQPRSGGRRLGYAVARGLIGAAAGTIAGAVIASGTKDDEATSNNDRALTGAIYGAMGFIAGGTVGLVYGGITGGRPRAVWRPLYEAGPSR